MLFDIAFLPSTMKIHIRIEKKHREMAVICYSIVYSFLDLSMGAITLMLEMIFTFPDFDIS